MKKHILTLLVGLIQLTVFAQTLERTLPTFKKVVISPFIDVELVKGPSEGIQITYENLEEDEINIDVKGNTLRVYLDDAKFRIRRESAEIKNDRRYGHAKVKAIITYKELENIQIAGNNSLTCKEEMIGKKLKIKVYDEARVAFASLGMKKIRLAAYGETDVDIEQVDANSMRIATYGDNHVDIDSGQAGNQTFRAYGDNIIDARGVKSIYAKVGFFGDNKLAVDAEHQVKITVLGEGDIRVGGNAHIRRSLVLGDPKITSL
jgi:hypothetical protein